ncbi:MAG: glycosyltransferase family 4 protein [Paludibacteraceae bacterium]|nr:glycosyltransferase family 4 protein [Paludibacteraceae bacterium]
MTTVYLDAKRAFLNRRGLGNYSRDVIRLLTSYAPDNDYCLLTPSTGGSQSVRQAVTPAGLWRLFPSLWRSYGCIRTIRHHGSPGTPKVYWGLSGEVPFGIRRTGCKVVVTMHDAIFMRYPELYSVGYRWLFARKVQYACDVADIIIAISEQTRKDLVTFFHADERKIRVVYQGCSHIFRDYARNDGASRQADSVRRRYGLPDRYVLDVGAIEPRKNLLNLIRAMASAAIDIPLVAIGGHSQYADLCRQEADRLGVRLLLRHDVDFADFPAVYASAEVLCYPSVFEGFGIPILEAMCVGTPVLTSTGSCFRETGGDAALYADPGNPREIGGLLRDILTDEGLRAEMRAKGYVQAGLFTDEAVAANLLRVLSL